MVTRDGRIDIVWLTSLLLFVASWIISVLGSIGALGDGVTFKIPDEVMYVLLAVIGIKGYEKLRQKGQPSTVETSRAHTVIKPCEYPLISECPLKVIDEAKRIAEEESADD